MPHRNPPRTPEVKATQRQAAREKRQAQKTAASKLTHWHDAARSAACAAVRLPYVKTFAPQDEVVLHSVVTTTPDYSDRQRLAKCRRSWEVGGAVLTSALE